MTYRFACDHVVPGCQGVVEAATTEELMGKVAEHANQAHGITEIDDALVSQVRAGIEEI